jgi:hypothetical protein
MQLQRLVTNLLEAAPVVGEATARRNVRVLASLLGPAYRGLLLKKGKTTKATRLAGGHAAHLDWSYAREFPEMTRLYEAAKASQWSASTDIDWSRAVDPHDPATRLLPDGFHPASMLRLWARLGALERDEHRHALVAWLLSQFLHGEQGALYAAAQVTEAVPWLDAKLYGSTQVVDEGRHVEVFHTYITTKLEKLYEINDNLYVVVDALMTDSRWDIKFLGMQILIEGLALGAFGMLRRLTAEPVLRDVLKYVITDEARHVHYGVVALERYYAAEVSERERREREDWAFEVVVLLRNRFLMHELYDEYYAHAVARAEWDRLLYGSRLMSFFRETLFRRTIPNLKRIGLLTDRVRGRYAELGLLAFEHERAAPELSASDLLD